MRWIVMIVLAMGAALTAHAKPSKPAKAHKAARTQSQFRGKLLSWQQFVMLPDKKQMNYLKAVRELIVYMESTQSKYEVASNTAIEDLKEQVAMMMDMMAILPKAYADQDETPAHDPDVPRWQAGKGWVCSAPHFVFSKSWGTCIRSVPGRVWGSTEAFAACPSPGEQAEAASDIALTVAGTGGKKNCITRNAWNALSPERQLQIRRGVTFPHTFWQNAGDEPDESSATVHGGRTHNPNGTRIAAAPSGRPNNPTGQGDPPPAPQDQQQPPAQQQAQPDEQPVTVESECKPAPRDCSNIPDKDKLIAEFRKDKDSNHCIVGGYFSKYPSVPKRAGKCDRSKFKGPCDGADYSCNPAVFCVGAKVDDKFEKIVKALPDTDPKKKILLEQIEKASRIDGSEEDHVTRSGEARIIRINLCQKVDANMSKDCNAQLKDHIEGRKFSNAIGGIGETYVACNPAKVKSFNGAQNRWNEIRNEVEAMYNQWCIGQDAAGKKTKLRFQALFCTECNVISERIIAANEDAVGKGAGCVDGTPLKPGTYQHQAPQQQTAPPANTIPEGQGAG